MDDLPDLSKTSLPELMQDLQEAEVSDFRAEWTLEQTIEHACSLAIGYGAGRTDLLPEYKATKERALRMARESLPLADDDWFRRQYPAAQAKGDWYGIACLLSGRLRQMEKRAMAANKRADALENSDVE